MPKIYLNFYFKDPLSSDFHVSVSVFTDSQGTSDYLRLNYRSAPPTFMLLPGSVSSSYDSRVHWFERLPIQGVMEERGS